MKGGDCSHQSAIRSRPLQHHNIIAMGIIVNLEYVINQAPIWPCSLVRYCKGHGFQVLREGHDKGKKSLVFISPELGISYLNAYHNFGIEIQS